MESSPCITVWDMNKREQVSEIGWKGGESGLNGDVYSLCFSKKKSDFFLAGTMNVAEFQFFEKGANYYPAWTASKVDGGVTCVDISRNDDRIAFLSGNKKLHILNLGRII
jgi:hypothetical protein